MNISQSQASYFRKQLISYFAENKNHLNPNFVVEDTDHLILFKQSAGADFYDAVIPMSVIIDSLSGASAVLTQEIVAELNVGGITIGQTFPVGTLLETLWKELLYNTQTSNLRFNTWNEYVEVGAVITPISMKWDYIGTISNSILFDNEGNSILNPALGSTSWPYNYNPTVPSSIIWTLAADFVNDLLLETKVVYASYYGVETRAGIPTIDPNDPTRIITDVSKSITVDIQSENTDYGWIAVVDTTPDYTHWKVNEFNTSLIGDTNEFIKYYGLTTIDGVSYKLYMYNYASELKSPLTLYSI